jgi:cell division septum initiation protein DivIVA
MSSSDAPPGQQKYYDPAEVEAYVRDVTETIKTLQARLQEASRRAEAAERALDGDSQPETASLGRALLLAGDVADKTIADANAKATEIIRAAEEKAADIVERANTEASRLIDAAGGAAADVFEKGEARLLAAVSAFMEGSNVLRAALGRIEDDATAWRKTARAPQPEAPETPNAPALHGDASLAASAAQPGPHAAGGPPSGASPAAGSHPAAGTPTVTPPTLAPPTIGSPNGAPRDGAGTRTPYPAPDAPTSPISDSPWYPPSRVTRYPGSPPPGNPAPPA